MSDQFCLDPDSKNVFNRNPNQRPIIKIGNWVEDQAIYDELQRQKRTGEIESSANCIKDYRIDNKQLYTTTQRDIGYPVEEGRHHIVYTEEEQSSFKKVPHYNPYKEQREINRPVMDQRIQHDTLNLTLPTNDKQNNFCSTTKSIHTGQLADIGDIIAPKFHQPVQKFKVTVE
ncbi:hypothetical protein SS50377_23137 [Spironucleus salmonicida]|uniref:Uncharacterized protein n=1 Tax=Spironucleus salmonicida TaxID=348837 RepID=V6LBB4_9EUKA|nr:hypothetical protein SS50377_23137 [Spironucleus salmonicida]|eukprot:EST41687.1 hypothetical protein SS50377_18774 [Spironucleus salmonicida]